MKSPSSSRIFYLLVLSQFGGTSLWFATNAILPQLQIQYLWMQDALGWLVSAVQLGFIVGTLGISLSGVTDKYSPSKVFFSGSFLGCLCNALCLLDLSSFSLMMTSRFLTGVCLAAIYPVGMKIAADWREHGLGHWLGALVGALVLGTAFPQILKLFPQLIEPQVLTLTVSCLALLSGTVVLIFIHDGPFRKPATKFSFHAVRDVFRQKKFRMSTFGYFGHMWEVYAFWAFVPWIITTYNQQTQNQLNVPLWSFLSIGAGGFACWLGGLYSQKVGSKQVAFIALASSAICCLLSPTMFQLPVWLFAAFILFWGFMVVPDSPQFSSMAAQAAQPQVRGSAITITTCIGFAITIFSIQLLSMMINTLPAQWVMILLLPGPVLGLLGMRVDKT